MVLGVYIHAVSLKTYISFQEKSISLIKAFSVFYSNSINLTRIFKADLMSLDLRQTLFYGIGSEQSRIRSSYVCFLFLLLKFCNQQQDTP